MRFYTYLLNLCKVNVMALNKKKAPIWCATPNHKGTWYIIVKTPNKN